MANYWTAISDLLVEPDDRTSIIFKTNGLHMFHAASPAIFLHLANRKDFKAETIRSLLESAFENIHHDHIGVTTREFWKRSSGTAGGLNKAAIRKYATALSTAVQGHAGSSEEMAI